MTHARPWLVSDVARHLSKEALRIDADDSACDVLYALLVAVEQLEDGASVRDIEHALRSLWTKVRGR